MKLYFRPRTTIVCVLLMTGMVRASFWQWDRHLQKLEYIKRMDQRLEEKVALLSSIIPTQNPLQEESWEPLIRRRVEVSGTYDFTKEMVLRNRRLDGAAGVYALTPLLIDGTNQRVIVNRGFIPLSISSQGKRTEFQSEGQVHFIGIIKEPTTRRFFLAPTDPETGPGKPWVDAWLRVDIAAMARQLPYPILPIQLEIMTTENIETAKNEIVRSGGGREELLIMGLKGEKVALPDVRPGLKYPVPAFDTVIPPGRHLGYVYEWAIMAGVTFLIMIILQLRPPRPINS